MDMIERVARVLEPLAWAALGLGDTLAYKNRRTSSLRKAKSAIEAMRAPPEDVIWAGAKQLPIGTAFVDAQDVWHSMIEAALKP